MKANEIQIGDWVYSTFSKLPCKVTYLKLHESGYASVETTNVLGVKDINSLSPIPITAEILEKNGFVPKFLDGCLTEYLIYKDIVDGLHEMYMRIAYFNTEEKEHKLECFDCRTGGCQIWIKYVHQLQHALRLCGIEKEIEL